MNKRLFSSIEQSQIDFYLPKYNRFHDDPQSLSWKNKSSQVLRFKILSEVFQYEKENTFTVHEIGCGLAHYKEYLDINITNAIYSGSDIIQEMITECKNKYPDTRFYNISITDDLAHVTKTVGGSDYYCLSGTFNTKEGNSTKEWESFVFSTMKNMFSVAKKGIAINFLTSFADFYSPSLYYADPSVILSWCMQKLSKKVILLHNYPLYEFTVIVYKKEFIESQIKA